MATENCNVKNCMTRKMVLGLICLFLGSGYFNFTATQAATHNRRDIEQVKTTIVTKEQFVEYKESNKREHDAIIRTLERIEKKIDR